MSHNPNKVMLNFSWYELRDVVKRIGPITK